jgi:hypothetical protein
VENTNLKGLWTRDLAMFDENEGKGAKRIKKRSLLLQATKGLDGE